MGRLKNIMAHEQLPAYMQDPSIWSLPPTTGSIEFGSREEALLAIRAIAENARQEKIVGVYDWFFDPLFFAPQAWRH